MRVTITTTINQRQRELAVKPTLTLLELLRDELHLKGTVEGCGEGVCGACTVLLDGKPISSCLTLAVSVQGRQVTTIEGLGQDGMPDRVQQAFLDHQAFQCGFCTPGMILTVKALLSECAAPSEQEIRDYLSGNLCRCGTYREVLAAVQSLVE